jgi:hypothetical protein
VVNSSLVAACRVGTFAPFRGKSSQMPVREPFTRPTALSKSCPVKPCQTQSNHFLTLTNLDHEQPPSHVLSGIKSGSPKLPDFRLRGNSRKFADTPHFALRILHSAFPAPPPPPLHSAFTILPFAFNILRT